MKIKVLAFGIAKDIFGGSTIEVELDGSNIGALKAQLEERYSKLRDLKSYMVAVNNEYATNDKVINGHDEIVIIPPVSGG